MTRTNSVVASLLILAFLVNPLFAQTGADKEAVKTIVDFAKKRDKVAKSEEERWHDRMGDAQKVGLKANAEKRKDISDTYWRTKSTYAEALSVVSEERSLLADMMNTERDGLKHGVIRLRGIAMHYTQLPVTYNPGRAAPEVEAIYRLQEARRNSKNRELIAGLGAEVDAYGDLAFARAQGRLTVEHYLAALGQPDLREQYRQRKSAYEAQVAKFAPCSVNGRKIEELQDSCFSGFLRLRL